MAVMTIEQQRAIALASARLRLQEQGDSAEQRKEFDTTLTSPEKIALGAEGLANRAKGLLPKPLQAMLPSTETAMPIVSGAATSYRNLFGEGAFPKQGESMVGQMLDPVALAAGGGAAKLTGMALNKAAPSLYPYLNGVLQSGAAGGAGIGVAGGDVGEGAGIGAGIGAVLPPMLKYGARGAGLLADAVRGRLPDVQLGKLMRDVAGKTEPEIRQALASAPVGSTAAQVAAVVDNDVWQALGAMAKRHDPDTVYRLIADKQLMGELGQLSKMARGSSAEEAATSREWMLKRLEAALKPVRESELRAAGEGGKKASEYLGRIGRAEGAMAGAGEQRVGASGQKLWTTEAGAMPEASVPDTGRLATRHDVPTLDFTLRQDMLQQPEIKQAIESFVSEADRLRGLTKSAGGFWQNKYAAELSDLEQRFAAGMRQLGIRDSKEALGLVKLYQGGEGTRLPVVHGFTPDDLTHAPVATAKPTQGQAIPPTGNVSPLERRLKSEAIFSQAKIESEFARNQLASLEANGVRPLTLTPVISRIDAMLKSKSTQMSDVEVKVLNSLREKLRIVGEGGVDPNALYELRKKGLNEIADTLSESGKLTKEAAKAALLKLRPMIDNALEDAGATQWGKGYLTKYKKGFEAIDRAEVMNGLRELYETNQKKYIDVIRGNDPEFIQQFIPNAKGITAIFSENVTGKLNALANKADVKLKMAERASKAETPLGSIMKRDIIKWRLPQFINYWFAAGNKGITALEEMVDRKVMVKLVDSMKSGQSALDAMNALPASERNKVLFAMQKADKIMPQVAAASAAGAQDEHQ